MEWKTESESDGKWKNKNTTIKKGNVIVSRIKTGFRVLRNAKGDTDEFDKPADKHMADMMSLSSLQNGVTKYILKRAVKT